MAVPSDHSKQPMARFMMDGILHKLAREQRQNDSHPPKKRPREQDPEVTSLGSHFSANEELLLDAPTNTGPFRLANISLKGILKSPTVHFPEELNFSDDGDTVPRPTMPLSPIGPTLRVPGTENTATLGAGPLPLPPPLPAPPHPPPKDAPLPPTMFNRKIEADEYLNEAAYKLYTNFMDKLSEFVDQQGLVIRMRLDVQEKRQELKQLREIVSQRDMLLINHLREHASDVSDSDATRTKLFDATVAARDLVGPKESEYEPLEIALGAAEHRLRQKYAAIEGRFEHFFRLNVTSTTRNSEPGEIEYEEPGSETSDFVEIGHKSVQTRDTDLFHGTFIGGDVRVGQLPLLAENARSNRLDRDTRRATLSDDTQGQSRRNPSNTTADDPNPDDVPTELLGITGAENTEIALKGVAFHSYFDLVEDPASLSNDLPIDDALTAVEDLVLLDESDKTQSQLSDYLSNFESTRDRVNRWLLHQLRVSHRAAYALRREILGLSPGVLDWTNLVLSEWSNDSLGHGQSYHHGSMEDDSELPAVIGKDTASFLDAMHATPIADPRFPSKPEYQPSTPFDEGSEPATSFFSSAVQPSSL